MGEWLICEPNNLTMAGLTLSHLTYGVETPYKPLLKEAGGRPSVCDLIRLAVKQVLIFDGRGAFEALLALTERQQPSTDGQGQQQ